jgi:hypothetical protein
MVRAHGELTFFATLFFYHAVTIVATSALFNLTSGEDGAGAVG